MMQQTIKLTFLLSMSLFSLTTQAASAFPRGCEVTGYGYNENELILNQGGQQTLYLIQNHSTQQIELERHEVRDVFMSPKLQSKLDPMHWAAFASDVENLHFQCFSHVADNTEQVNCNDVLDVCQYPRVKFALSNMGNYWVSTNKEQGQVVKDAAAKGIYLRW